MSVYAGIFKATNYKPLNTSLVHRSFCLPKVTEINDYKNLIKIADHSLKTSRPKAVLLRHPSLATLRQKQRRAIESCAR